MTREWRGVTLDNRSAEMMDEVARLCPGITLDAMQGSYSSGVSASAGTHSGGGSIDLATNDYGEVVYQMRRVGWAAWHRTPAQGFDHHIHGIAGPAGPGDLAPAASDQWADYLNGYSGLASNAPDDGPRDFVGVTWEQYKQQGGKDTGWLLEGVIDMAASTIVHFVYDDSWFEADLIAGQYWAFSSHNTLEDRRHVLAKAGIPFTNWEGGAPVANPDAFGVRV